MTPKVSVIVPVYKAENYIRRCLDSLLAQTMPDFELLLIDDGSPDNSGAICDEYSRRDARIRVFHKKNGGVASARQMGIENAIGEYSIHCDPDDWVEPNMLEELYAKAKETDADMVICDFYTNTIGEQKYIVQKPMSLDPISVFKGMMCGGGLFGATWNKLIRTSLYEEYDLRFPAHLTYCEDLFVVSDLVLHDIKISYLPSAFYHYQISENQSSLTKVISKRRIDSFHFLIEYFINKFPNATPSFFYVQKLTYKEMLFYSGFYSKHEIICTYQEINNLFIDNYKKGKHSSRLLYYALTNRYMYARLLLLLSIVKRKIMY